jgi:hypothetical protein
MGNKRNRNKQPNRPTKPQPRRISMGPEHMANPAAWNPRSQVLQQLGLHKPEGVMRLISVLMHKFDPRGLGITIGPFDLQQAVHNATVEGRSQLQVIGQPDGLHLVMVSEAAARAGAHADNAVARQQGRPESPLPPEGDFPGQPGPQA